MIPANTIPSIDPAKRKVKSKELAEFIGITEQILSLLKTGKVKGIRLSTLNSICQFLSCRLGDILEYQETKCSLEARVGADV